MKKILIVVLLLALLADVDIACSQKSNVPKKPKNVVLLIGDGMGLGSIYSLIAVRDNTAFEQFKHIGFSKTQSADNFITDSGAGGSALSTGKRIKNKQIAIDPVTKEPLETLVELSNKNGLKTGVVSACAITHATPASFLSHSDSRYKQEEIALNMLPTNPTLFIGGGRDYFEKREDGLNLSDSLRTRGFQVVYTMDELLNVKTEKVAGLLYDDNPKSMLNGRGDFLPVSSEKALELLSQNNDKGFFLMIEGSQIDFESHDNNYLGMIAEMDDFNATLNKVLDFARKDGNTLVVVTADHETGGLTPLDSSSVSTRNARYNTFGHTPVMVPVFAFGPNSETFCGIYNNNTVFDKIVAFLFGR
ncbi:MAG: alkaline phosphatase [Bacteroidales bacterium]|nr:alkaline phosphatase [Bacteroidales bacterium]